MSFLVRRFLSFEVNMTLKQNFHDIVEMGILLLIVLSMIFGIPIIIHRGNIKEAFTPDFKPYDEQTTTIKLDEVQFNTLITTLRGENK